MTSEDTIKKIQAYLVGKNIPSPWDMQAFIGMIETGEATYQDFQAAGGDELAAAVAKSKQHSDEILSEGI